MASTSFAWINRENDTCITATVDAFEGLFDATFELTESPSMFGGTVSEWGVSQVLQGDEDHPDYGKPVNADRINTCVWIELLEERIADGEIYRGGRLQAFRERLRGLPTAALDVMLTVPPERWLDAKVARAEWAQGDRV